MATDSTAKSSGVKINLTPQSMEVSKNFTAVRSEVKINFTPDFSMSLIE